jgi:hypothetical protein
MEQLTVRGFITATQAVQIGLDLLGLGGRIRHTTAPSGQGGRKAKSTAGLMLNDTLAQARKANAWRPQRWVECVARQKRRD